MLKQERAGFTRWELTIVVAVIALAAAAVFALLDPAKRMANVRSEQSRVEFPY